MFTLLRALTYATLFTGLVLLYAPAIVLRWAGAAPPPEAGAAQILGMVIGLLGAAIALWCILTFSVAGKGTPAPFDPPRRLVESGPYRFVRNPMYIGAALALAGAALFYGSVALLCYVAAFLALTHALVVLYEEPVLRRTFGEAYADYCSRVGRWLPGTGRNAGVAPRNERPHSP